MSRKPRPALKSARRSSIHYFPKARNPWRFPIPEAAVAGSANTGLEYTDVKSQATHRFPAAGPSRRKIGPAAVFTGCPGAANLYTEWIDKPNTVVF